MSIERGVCDGAEGKYWQKFINENLFQDGTQKSLCKNRGFFDLYGGGIDRHTL